MRGSFFAQAICFLAVAPPAQSAVCHAAFDNFAADRSVASGGFLQAVRVRAEVTMRPSRIEVRTGGRTGPAEVSIWSHDATKNQPRALLAKGAWTVAAARGWQGAMLQNNPVIPKGTTYWVGWHLPRIAQAPVVRGGLFPLPAADVVVWSPDAGKTWRGPTQRSHHIFRVHCSGQPRIAGDYTLFGRRCQFGLTVNPWISARGRPYVGGTFSVLVFYARTAAVWLAVGASDKQFGPIRLPLDLSPFGAPLCLMASSAEILLPNRPTGTEGIAEQRISVPMSASLLGKSFFSQWWCAVPRPNGLPFVLSMAGRAKIGG